MVTQPPVPRSAATLSHTTYVWLIASLLILAFTYRAGRWRNNDVFVSDMGGYDMYLPAAFLTNDLGRCVWLRAVQADYRPDLTQEGNFVPLPTGREVFKYPMGMAIAYSPFFFLARAAYYAQGIRGTTGYEMGYQLAITWGCVLYVLLGLWVLGRELRHYFADNVTALTLLIIAVGTNLLIYSSQEVMMAHGILLMLNALLLRHTRRWYTGGQWSDAIKIGLASGFMVLIRPSEAMLLSVPVLWGLSSRAAVAARIQFWRQRWGQTLLIPALVLLIGGLQLVFWRVVGGQWLVPFYKGETFIFSDPHLADGVFSFRKGWLVYSPLMGLALLGIVWVRRWAPAVWLLLIGVVPVYLYVTFCWWNWEYGGSYGGRAVISLYPLLAFGLAAFWQRWLQPGRWVWGLLLPALLLLSVLQNYQYLVGLIDCCTMSWAMYKERFLMLGWQG